MAGAHHVFPALLDLLCWKRLIPLVHRVEMEKERIPTGPHFSPHERDRWEENPHRSMIPSQIKGLVRSPCLSMSKRWMGDAFY